jgi:eukaryotic-like serine/threonine-protein kinase
MLPHRIGRYHVCAELGRGATSIVYQAVDPLDGRIVAIKALQRSGADADGDADSIRLRFRHEAEVIGRLRHPGIVAVDEFGEDGLHSWIAMEHVQGGNLDDLLLRHPVLGPERALLLMEELLDALGCVHRAGICHRDLKPANIMLTPDGHVKLTDFGVARLRDLGLTRVSSIIGTPAFMAPEQFTGGTLDHRADLFACGVLLFLLLSGRRPFAGAPAAVMHQILNEPAPSVSDASGGVVARAYDEVVARALARRPDDRFASAQEMRDALRAAALQAADAPLVTVVATLVQGGGRGQAGLPQGSQPWSAPEHPTMRAAQPMPRMVMSEAPGQPRLVDAFALYTPGAEARAAFSDDVCDADADRTLAASAASHHPGLSAELCAAAQQLLTQRLGPSAGGLAERAAALSRGSRAAFFAHLLAALPAPCPAALRSQLEALLAAQ